MLIIYSHIFHIVLPLSFTMATTATFDKTCYNNNNNKYFISANSPYGYKKIYKTHIINKLKIIRTNGNQ